MWSASSASVIWPSYRRRPRPDRLDVRSNRE
jgi:hypothetical protein